MDAAGKFAILVALESAVWSWQVEALIFVRPARKNEGEKTYYFQRKCF